MQRTKPKARKPKPDPKAIGDEIRAQGCTDMADCLIKGGITPDFLRNKLLAELNATDTKVMQHQGVCVYSRPLIAHEIRQRARMDAHKLLDHYPSERHTLDVQTSNRSPEEVTELRKAATEVIAQIRRDANKRNH